MVEEVNTMIEYRTASPFVKAVIDLEKSKERLKAIESGNDPEVNRKAAELTASINQEELKRQVTDLVNSFLNF